MTDFSPREIVTELDRELHTPSCQVGPNLGGVYEPSDSEPIHARQAKDRLSSFDPFSALPFYFDHHSVDGSLDAETLQVMLSSQ